MKNFALSMLAMAFCSCAYATSFDLSDSTLTNLSNDITWHRLLLYKDGKSDVPNGSFFLSDTGALDNQKRQIDPKQELQALLVAWESDDYTSLCRFPARLHFVKQRLALDKPLPDCPSFEQWQNDMNAKQLSLIFADEHPNNLAAGFGHSFIKVDRLAGEPIAINYTPNFQLLKNPALGAYHSLTGHYTGLMEILPFAQKQTDYLFKDERDLWQFELDLSKQETAQLIRHLWEVKDMTRPYYLTHDNCATEIVRLIDVVRPNLALSNKTGITTPAKIAKLIDRAGLVKQSHHLPSSATLRQANKNNSPSPHTQGNPTTATPMHRLGLGYQTGGQFELSYRTAYHDVLDNPKGVREWLDLQILTGKISYQQRLRLDELKLIDWRSYNPINTAKGYDGLASGFALGVERVGKKDGLALQTSLEKGVSWAVGAGQGGALPKGLCYGLVAPMLRIAKQSQLGVGLTAGCVYHWSDNLRARGELELPYWQGRHQGELIPKANLAIQYDLNEQNALRLSWQQDKYHDEASIAYQWYF